MFVFTNPPTLHAHLALRLGLSGAACLQLLSSVLCSSLFTDFGEVFHLTGFSVGVLPVCVQNIVLYLQHAVLDSSSEKLS